VAKKNHFDSVRMHSSYGSTTHGLNPDSQPLVPLRTWWYLNDI
jgi:hypothetical protein